MLEVLQVMGRDIDSSLLPFVYRKETVFFKLDLLKERFECNLKEGLNIFGPSTTKYTEFTFF